jgi:hypothetical protein
VTRTETEPLRGFAVLHRDGNQLAVWHVAYGDRQAKSVNAVVVDLDDSGVEETLGSLAWRQILTRTPSTTLSGVPGVEGSIHELSDICAAFIREADDVRASGVPRPSEPRPPKSDSPGHVALAAADHLVASWNYWIRSIRKVTPPSDPAPPALAPRVLEVMGENPTSRVVGEG